jgi:3-methyladenine DNA glycosylase AlkD
VSGADFAAAHEEVLAALQAIGNPRRGEAVQHDRGSALQHLGIGFPALRARVKQGFSFSKRPAGEVLAVWDALWQRSPVGDVLFAALAHYEPVVRKQVPAGLWPVLRGWNERVDNWCHADMLAGLYSRMLEVQFEDVYPQLQAWNAAPGEWQRRLSITSLVHYTGKNAVFLASDAMLPLLSACAGDPRPSVQMALGWVLRELGRTHPREAAAFLQQHGARMSAKARARAAAGRQAATSPST